MNALFKGGEQSSEVIKRAKQNTGVKGEWRKKKNQPRFPCISAQDWATFHFIFF